MFTSAKWKAKFTSVAQEFADHKRELQADLQMYASVGVGIINETLAVMGRNVEKVMGVVFEFMASPQERELANFISGRLGGAENVLRDPRLLEQVIAKQGAPVDHDLSATGQGDERLTAVTLRRDVAKDVDVFLQENWTVAQKLEAKRIQLLEDVGKKVTHETDRVIRVLQSGPHEGIVDQVCRLHCLLCAATLTQISC